MLLLWRVSAAAADAADAAGAAAAEAKEAVESGGGIAYGSPGSSWDAAGAAPPRGIAEYGFPPGNLWEGPPGGPLLEASKIKRVALVSLIRERTLTQFYLKMKSTDIPSSFRGPLGKDSRRRQRGRGWGLFPPVGRKCFYYKASFFCLIMLFLVVNPALFRVFWGRL